MESQRGLPSKPLNEDMDGKIQIMDRTLENILALENWHLETESPISSTEYQYLAAQ